MKNNIANKALEWQQHGGNNVAASQQVAVYRCNYDVTTMSCHDNNTALGTK